VEVFEDLEKTLSEILKENPTDCNALNKLGYIYLHSNNFFKSQEFYVKSLANEANQFEPNVSLALIYTIKLRLGKALYYLLKAKEVNPDSAEVLTSINEINTAIIKKEANLPSENIDKLLTEALEKVSDELFEEALEIYLKLHCIFPEDENILFNLALTFLKNDEYNLSLKYFQEIILKNPTNAMAYHYCGILANILKNPEKALDFHLKSLELSPSLADILFNGRYAHYNRNKIYDEEYLEECPNCKNKNFEIISVVNQSISSSNFNIINPLRQWASCKNCSLIFSNPRPRKDILKQYSFELSIHAKNLYEKSLNNLILENNAYNERLNSIRKFIQTGKCLDINANTGIFASLAKIKDFNVISIEENLLKCKKIRDSYNLDVENVSFENYENKKDSFELITLWESFEKIPNIDEYLNKIYKLLKKDGIFAFSLHILDSFFVKTLNLSYPLWYYPDHIYFFNSDLLKEKLKTIGFDILDIQVVGRDYLANTEFYCKKVIN